MYSIDILVEEHAQISKLNAAMKNMCVGILEGASLEEAPFRQFIDTVRNFADRHHHQKEEKVLFSVMTDHLGKIATTLIKHGMLVEHDLGRLYVLQTEKALDRYVETQQSVDKLDVITNAMAYVDLLSRHITKENTLVYPYAEKHLSEEDKHFVDEETKKLEDIAASEHIQEKYLDIIQTIEKKAQA